MSSRPGGTTTPSAAAAESKDSDSNHAPAQPSAAPPYPKFDINPEISAEEKAAFLQMLHRRMDAFAPIETDEPPAPAPGIKHTIHLLDTQPHKQRPHRQSPANQLVTTNTVKDLLRRKVIIKSSSPWSSPVVVVPKPHNPTEKRMCIDFRKLNAQTKKDAYPVPLIDDCLELCKTADWFSIVDIKDAFWHVEMDEESKSLTAFVTPEGLFQWNRMPFGLTNAPATFQRYVDQVLQEHIGKYCAAFFDDCLVYTTGTLEEHMAHVDAVLITLAKAGLECAAKKCKFAYKEITYVGFVLSKGTIKPEPSLIRGIMQFPAPTNLKELRQFLGLTNYYRRFVKGFASIALPLYKLTKKGVPYEWSSACIAAFNRLRDVLGSAPCLRTPDYSKLFVLQTDASEVGIGAVLEQEHEGEPHPVAFISRKLNDAETRYSGTERECLAVVWAISQLEHYLVDKPFIVVTDHAALQWLPQKKFDNNRLMRWALKLQEFSFTVRHRAGTANANADALSRSPLPNSAPSNDDIRDPAIGPYDTEPKYIRLITSHSSTPRMVSVAFGEQAPFPRIDGQSRIAVDSKLRDRGLCEVMVVDESQLQELAEAQRSDKDLRARIDYLEHRRTPASWPSTMVTKFIEHSRDFIMVPQSAPCPPILKYFPAAPKRGLASFTPVRPRVVVPKSFRTKLLRMFHDAPFGGHFGIKRTIRKLSINYWWSSMQQDVSDYVSSCEACNREKQRRRNPDVALGSNPQPAYPFHIISIDHVGPLQTSEDFKYILVIIDHFSRWAIAVPVRDTEAPTTALALYEEVYNRFGVPKMLISDRGSSFVNAAIALLHAKLGVKHLFASAYHPQSNGTVERLNGTLKQILAAVSATHGDQWVQVLQPAVFAYNTSRSEATGFTPYYVLFGREAVTPGDQLAELADSADIDYTGQGSSAVREYVQHLLQNLGECHDVVKAIFNSQTQQKNADRLSKARIPFYQVGDSVWVRDPQSNSSVGARAGHRAPWMGPGKVVARISELAYKVQIAVPTKNKAGSKIAIWTVHVSKMKPHTSRVLPEADESKMEDVEEPKQSPNNPAETSPIEKNGAPPRATDVPVPRPSGPKSQRPSPDVGDPIPLEEYGIVLPSAAPPKDDAPVSGIGASTHARHRQMARPNYSDTFASRHPVHAQHQRYSLPPRRSRIDPPYSSSSSSSPSS